MFSGIIERVGKVTGAERRADAMDLRVASGFVDLREGESIAVNGVCLTATHFTAQGEVAFHVSGETLARTGLGRLGAGARVNLERAVTLGTRLSGHIVQGHVDGQGVFSAVEAAGDSHEVHCRLPAALRPYVVEKGSITLDGISLTVNAIEDAAPSVEETFPEEGATFGISLMIVPHTWAHTALPTLKTGEAVNVEVDVLAKYVENLMRYGKGNGEGEPAAAPWAPLEGRTP